jgi:hypothetical protein
MDALLPIGAEPPLGAHLVTPRRGYLHHGIYVGQGRVVHYSARALCLIRRPVEEVSLDDFGQKKIIWVRGHLPGSYAPAEIIRRAHSRLGENRYRLLTNNCEHFCEWCARGLARSAQVESARATLENLWRRVRLTRFASPGFATRRRTA